MTLGIDEIQRHDMLAIGNTSVLQLKGSTVVFWPAIERIFGQMRGLIGILPKACASDGRREGEGGSGRRVVSPRVLWGHTMPPVLKPVSRVYLLQFVEHTPHRPHTNWLGLATDCASDMPYHKEVTRTF